MNDKDMQVVLGLEDTVEALENLRDKILSGEVNCAALRLFRKDGSFEDIVIGGDELEQEEALAKLKRMYEQAH